MSHSKVVIYEHVNYGGASRVVTDDLTSMPSGWNERISSIKTNTPVALFQHSNYAGDVLVVNQDTPNFTNIRGRNFDDRVSSIRVRPIYILLNVIQGDFDNTLARSYDDINDEVVAANELFGPYGFNVEVDDIRIGDTELYEPKTTEDLNRLRDSFRLDNRLNVTYFTGELFNTASWRWRVQSVKLELAPGGSGSAHADLYTGTNFSGTVQHYRSDQEVLNADVEDNVRSIRLHGDTHITVFSQQNFQGDRRTFRKDIPDLGPYHAITDWWRDKGGHVGGDLGNWTRLDVTLRPKNSQLAWLAKEVAHALALPNSDDPTNLMHHPPPSNPNFTIQQAEAAMEHLHSNPALAPFFEARR